MLLKVLRVVPLLVFNLGDSSYFVAAKLELSGVLNITALVAQGATGQKRHRSASYYLSNRDSDIEAMVYLYLIANSSCFCVVSRASRLALLRG